MGPLAAVGLLALMVMGLVALIGALLDRVAYKPLRESPRLSAVVSALVEHGKLHGAQRRRAATRSPLVAAVR